ncbi:MAG: SDR family oxidoreductase [Acidimicrobiales bacterium]
MELTDKVVVVTGAGSGIGAALVERFRQESPRVVVGADLAGADRVVDVTDRAAVAELVRSVEDEHGPIDLYCSNAGIATGAGVDAAPEVWQRAWDVNVMGTVHAAQALLPTVRARGEGYLLVTASAAGLLTNLGDAPYSATKHAAVGLAEWLAITHADDGLTVSCLCPQGVRTPMLMNGLDAGDEAAAVVEMMGIIEPATLADVVVAGLRSEQFLILPHPEVAEYLVNKATTPDRWIGGMRKLQRRLR